MNIQTRYGLHLAALRKKKGVSQAELAKLTDLDRTYISSVESGKRNISLVNIERIALALGCTIYQFFEDLPESASNATDNPSETIPPTEK